MRLKKCRNKKIFRDRRNSEKSREVQFSKKKLKKKCSQTKWKKVDNKRQRERNKRRKSSRVQKKKKQILHISCKNTHAQKLEKGGSKF